LLFVIFDMLLQSGEVMHNARLVKKCVRRTNILI